MTRKFEHIGAPEARSFIVERLSDDALLGRKGFTMRQSTYVLPYPPSQRSYARDLVAAVCADDLPNRGVRAALDILNIPSDANGSYYRATSVFDL